MDHVCQRSGATIICYSYFNKHRDLSSIMSKLTDLINDHELREEFYLDFDDAYHDCESLLIQLEGQPQDHDLINALFRHIHTIKGNLVYVGFNSITPLLQHIEDILDEMRNGQLVYVSELSDVILLALDITKLMVDSKIHEKTPDMDINRLNYIYDKLKLIITAEQDHKDEAIYQSILALDPNLKLHKSDHDTDFSEKSLHEIQINEKIVVKVNNLLEEFNIHDCDDLRFFQNLIIPIESRSRFWLGRSERLLFLALNMNRYSTTPVDPDQLTAAVYMHDIAMAFLPIKLLHKKSQLNSDEKRTIHAHSRSAYELLHRMVDWDEAAEMVLQHHERMDGKGYPKGLLENEICDGAKILSIIDTFDACTHERAHISQLKRPFVRGILEVNRQAGSQLSQKWVNIFNQMMHQLNYT